MQIAPPSAEPDLAAVLVRLARERGARVERLRAEKLLAEAGAAWPGDPRLLWMKWLATGATSLGLRAKAMRMTVDDALRLAQDGALVVAASQGDQLVSLVLGFDGGHAEVAAEGSNDSRRLTPTQLTSELGAPIEQEPDKWVWMVVTDVELGHDHGGRLHRNPVNRLLDLMRPERSDIWVVVVFAFSVGVLSLATPIAVESLVNMVAFGRMLQPLLVLSIMLFGFLAFSGLLRALQTFVVEIIQQRLFVRVAADLAYRLPRIKPSSLHGEYGPELTNRFFDVVTLQKVVAQLLLDGVTILLTTLVGMTVLAFYHPFLLGFDVVLLALVTIGVFLMGRGAFSTAIQESIQKYRLAAWLDDLARCSSAFKSSGGAEFALDRANYLTAGYLECRRGHFKVLFRQLLFIFGLQAVAGTVLLGCGGWLVIREQLTLGQLIAAELIVATILSALNKLGKHIEGFCDLVASVDKLGHLFDLEMEPQDGQLALTPGSGVRVRITSASDGFDGARQEVRSLALESGERVALLDPAGAGGSPLIDMLYGLSKPEGGHVEIEHADPRDLHPETLRTAVAMVRSVDVFEGTLAENIHLGRPDVSMTDVRWALQGVRMLDTVLRLPEGLDTPLNGAGGPFIPSQLMMLMLARAVVGRPRMVLVDGALDGLGDQQLEVAIDLLTDPARGWTLLATTGRRTIAERFDRVIDLAAEDADAANLRPTSNGEAPQ
ncbi:Alpha-hemolysin translocation ATP-binding protein HlyB [Pirellulimonas nuda]|uniref:Alpha-hemolysin translocation ATP-binding protein HlyB n=1 Tax=Pirellulimonas nuda TaxID=2528009 RepID=A0A518DE34_9BACT|nr:ATP-binding cassette domain-containing protein [Pirellulimonas nuda]QDU89726.1 Alpha-hemolysin translocation ATP-binding protein HlyB [Pirellulimonas nuda]